VEDFPGFREAMRPDRFGCVWKASKFVNHGEFCINYPNLKEHKQSRDCPNSFEECNEKFWDGDEVIDGVSIFLAGLDRRLCFTTHKDLIDCKLKNRFIYKAEPALYNKCKKSTGPELKIFKHILVMAYTSRTTADEYTLIAPCELCHINSDSQTGYVLMALILGEPCKILDAIIYSRVLDECFKVHRFDEQFGRMFWTNPKLIFNWENAEKAFYRFVNEYSLEQDDSRLNNKRKKPNSSNNNSWETPQLRTPSPASIIPTTSSSSYSSISTRSSVPSSTSNTRGGKTTNYNKVESNNDDEEYLLGGYSFAVSRLQ